MPVTVSQAAYSACELLKKALDASGEEYFTFPDGNYNKGQVVNELFKVKKVLKKIGTHASARYGFDIPFEEIVRSDRTVKGTGKAAPKATTPSFKQPVSRGRNLPNYYLVNRFMNDVQKESVEINASKNDALKAQIADLMGKLNKSKDDDEQTLLIQQLAKANEERRSLKTSVIIEAVRNTSAASEYRAYDFTSFISTNPVDYQDE